MLSGPRLKPAFGLVYLEAEGHVVYMPEQGDEVSNTDTFLFVCVQDRLTIRDQWVHMSALDTHDFIKGKCA